MRLSPGRRRSSPSCRRSRRPPRRRAGRSVPPTCCALKDVGDPQLSPDGQWVAYTVTRCDAKEDESDTDIYMAPFAGGDAAAPDREQEGGDAARA